MLDESPNLQFRRIRLFRVIQQHSPRALPLDEYIDFGSDSSDEELEGTIVKPVVASGKTVVPSSKLGPLSAFGRVTSGLRTWRAEKGKRRIECQWDGVRSILKTIPSRHREAYRKASQEIRRASERKSYES